MREVEILRVDVSAKAVRKMRDFVAEEKPFSIRLNKVNYATIFCSPTNLKELVVGHLLSEGIVQSIDEIEETIINVKGVCNVKLRRGVDVEKRLNQLKPFSRIIASACGGAASPRQYLGKLPKITSNLKVKAEVILNCVGRLNTEAETFRRTGGVHAAATYTSNGHLLAFAEDVGRHNAVDKAIGITAQNKSDFGSCFLALSGRLTGDITLKAAKVGIPIVASSTAAVDSGITIAKETCLTLIGFVRGKRLNIYNAPERILL
ncbi:MAG: formate dehydrogenase accessory sulfurtransferase FdhD [Candidatus Bathyarchaeia archaeon]